MKNTPVYLLFLLMLLCSCKQDRKKLLTGKWHVVKFENNLQLIVGKWNAVQMANPELDSFFINGQNYIDTVGKKNDPATNIRLYGTANMDSMRIMLQKQFDSAKNMQNSGVTTTSFYFGDDGVAILSFHGTIDSSAWGIDSLGYLVFDDLNEASKGEKVRMEIIEVSDTVLKLKFRENNVYSIVTFHPDGVKERKNEPMVETYFNFREDSIAELTFNGKTDSARWYLENDSVINISSVIKNPDGEPMKWDILALDKDNLALKIVENSSISTLTFKRQGK